jgi:hypothetical protein
MVEPFWRSAPCAWAHTSPTRSEERGADRRWLCYRVPTLPACLLASAQYTKPHDDIRKPHLTSHSSTPRSAVAVTVSPPTAKRRAALLPTTHMATDAFIAAFRLLHTNDSRQEAVERLAQELNGNEWRALQSILVRRSFQLDIIGRLPVELVAHVFAYLDASAPYRLQRVRSYP